MRIGLISLLVKIGAKMLPVFLKLLKSAKSFKAALALASFGLWDLFFSWQFAVLLMLTIFIHESGHVWAMRRMGMKTKGFYFVPLLGGAAVSDGMFPSRGAESFVAIMGPIWGGLMLVPALVLWRVNDDPMWAGITGWIAMINLFNLLPVLPLDGGRILRSVTFSFSRLLGFVLVGAGVLASALVSIAAGLGLFALLFVVGGIEILIEARHIKAVKKLNKKIALLQEVFPMLKSGWVVSALSQQKKCYEDGYKDWVQKFAAEFPFDDNNIERVCEALADRIPSDKERMFGFVWEFPRDYENISNELFKKAIRYRITTHILDWLCEGYDNNMCQLFQNPMSGRMVAYSVAAYCAVAGLLYYAMHLTRHIPGSQAALAIFQQ